MRLLAIDIGNHSCGAVLFQGEDAVAKASWKAGDPPPLPPHLGTGTDPLRAVASSVNASGEALVEAWLTASGLSLLHIPAEIPYPIPVQVENPERVGPDRILGTAAALKACRGPCIVVDAGTAVTVDVAVPDRGFLGGAILPGRWLMAEALNQGTDRLPSLDPVPVDDPLGATTEEAIGAGVFIGWVGAVREVLAAMRRRVGACTVFL
ncbi:MAG: type III pantothenate kinase, partial [Planctomycetota bacterium]